MGYQTIAPLGRLNFPLMARPSSLIHCRWCGDRLLKIRNAFLCEECDCPSEIIKELQP